MEHETRTTVSVVAVCAEEVWDIRSGAVLNDVVDQMVDVDQPPEDE